MWVLSAKWKVIQLKWGKPLIDDAVQEIQAATRPCQSGVMWVCIPLSAVALLGVIEFFVLKWLVISRLTYVIFIPSYVELSANSDVNTSIANSFKFQAKHHYKFGFELTV